MYAFTCCNLRVGKFDVSATNVNFFWRQYFIKLRLMDSGNAIGVRQYSWNTVIESHSNAKEI